MDERHFGMLSVGREATRRHDVLKRLCGRPDDRFRQARWRFVSHPDSCIASHQRHRRWCVKPISVADVDNPHPAGDRAYSVEQLRLGEHGSTTEREVLTDNIRGNLDTETIKLGQPLVMSTDHTEMPGALFAGASGQGVQPCGMILLGDALLH